MLFLPEWLMLGVNDTSDTFHPIRPAAEFLRLHGHGREVMLQGTVVVR